MLYEREHVLQRPSTNFILDMVEWGELRRYVLIPPYLGVGVGPEFDISVAELWYAD